MPGLGVSQGLRRRRLNLREQRRELPDRLAAAARAERLQGSLVLASTLPYVPVGVHLAVIDPGVGGSRRALALRDEEGRFFVGPDNGLLVPAAVVGVLTRSWSGALSGMLWGGFARIFLMQHVTWSVNSGCHFVGSRRFDTDDRSPNVFWLALPSLGESWHHNHHAFPRSATHGLRRREIDPSGAIIATMEKLGLASRSDLVSYAVQRGWLDV